MLANFCTPSTLLQERPTLILPVEKAVQRYFIRITMRNLLDLNWRRLAVVDFCSVVKRHPHSRIRALKSILQKHSVPLSLAVILTKFKLGPVYSNANAVASKVRTDQQTAQQRNRAKQQVKERKIIDSLIAIYLAMDSLIAIYIVSDRLYSTGWGGPYVRLALVTIGRTNSFTCLYINRRILILFRKFFVPSGTHLEFKVSEWTKDAVYRNICVELSKCICIISK